MCANGSKRLTWIEMGPDVISSELPLECSKSEPFGTICVGRCSRYESPKKARRSLMMQAQKPQQSSL